MKVNKSINLIEKSELFRASFHPIDFLSNIEYSGSNITNLASGRQICPVPTDRVTSEPGRLLPIYTALQAVVPVIFGHSLTVPYCTYTPHLNTPLK